MSTNLPSPRNVFIPELPQSMREVADVVAYLKDLRTTLELQFAKQFDNADTIRNASDTLDSTVGVISVTVGTLGTDLTALTTTVSTLSSTVSGLSTVYANVTFSNLTAPVVNTNINFNSKQGIAFVVENRTTDPSSTVSGMLWFRTDVT